MAVSSEVIGYSVLSKGMVIFVTREDTCLCGEDNTKADAVVNPSVTPVENSVGILIICYISFRTINFLCFLSYSFPVLRYRVIRRGQV
jgi:hypothetical protein